MNEQALALHQQSADSVAARCDDLVVSITVLAAAHGTGLRHRVHFTPLAQDRFLQLMGHQLPERDIFGTLADVKALLTELS